MKNLKLMTLILLFFGLSACAGENSGGGGGNARGVSDTEECEANDSLINFSGIESISSVTNTSVQLNWTNASEAKGYAVFQVVGGESQYLKFVESPASSTDVTGLTSNTSYTFQVKTVDSAFAMDANTATESVTTDSAPPDQLLDSIANSSAVYSVRKLTNTYTGSAVAVRRDSDDVVADIGFDGYDLDVTALNAHLGGANGYIETWYDQSGAGQDLTQSNTGYQPQIIASGTPSGQPAIRFDGVDDYLINSSLSYTARSGFFAWEMITGTQSTSDLAQIWGHYSGGTQVASDPRSPTTMSFDGSGSTTADYALDGAAYSGSYEENPTSTGWAMDTTHVLAVEFSADQSMSEHTVGSLFPAFSVGDHQFGGDLSEIIIFSDVKDSTDKSAIESSMSNYYQ